MDEDVTVPPTECPISDMADLENFVLPLTDRACYGIDLFENTLEFVSNQLSCYNVWAFTKEIDHSVTMTLRWGGLGVAFLGGLYNLKLYDAKEGGGLSQ